MAWGKVFRSGFLHASFLLLLLSILILLDGWVSHLGFLQGAREKNPFFSFLEEETVIMILSWKLLVVGFVLVASIPIIKDPPWRNRLIPLLTVAILGYSFIVMRNIRVVMG